MNRAVKRNIERFPEDFMFQLSADEFDNLRFQFGTSSLKSQFGTSRWGGRRYPPYAFTEQRGGAYPRHRHGGGAYRIESNSRSA